MKKYALLALAVALLPLAAFAFTVSWVEGTYPVVINEPTKATGYFGELSGEPQVFDVNFLQPTELSLQILQPDIEGQKQDLSLAVLNPNEPEVPLGVIIGPAASWTPVTYQGHRYLKAPEFRATLPAGSYEIRLWSSNNDTKYVLVVGNDERDIFSRIANGISLLPRVESEFFGRSGASAILAPIILWPLVILILIVLALVWYFAWRSRARRRFDRL